MYQVRWEYQGRVHYANTEAEDTARIIAQAIAGHFSGDEMPVEVWSGTERKARFIS